jgi:hypothetical protein
MNQPFKQGEEKPMLRFVKSIARGGNRWQFALCLLLSLIVGIYALLHGIWYEKRGKEYVQLSKEQLDIIHSNLALFPDSLGGKGAGLTTIRSERDALIIRYLQTEYHNKLEEGYLADLRFLMARQNSRDLYQFLSKARILVKGPFWLTGNMIFVEAWFWSLFGVLVSLIYYVSLANAKGSTITGNDDLGAFDPREVPGQIAKMFYAPACTIVLLLGYHFISASDNMVDVSVNKGALVFAFIAGFYSGRVMKFLDRLKELLLPAGASEQRKAPAIAPNADVEVNLSLEPVLSKTPEGIDIAEAGYNAAEVMLIPEKGGEPIALVNPVDDQGDSFHAQTIPSGKYTLLARMAHKMDDERIVNLEARTEVELQSGANAFSLELALDEAAG